MLLEQYKSLIHSNNWLTNLSQTSAFLFDHLNSLEGRQGQINWCGFYLYDSKTDSLFLGPFQGKIACTCIKMGQGVVGTCAQQQTLINVPNVHEFKGHIACDSRSESEIVVPLLSLDGRLLGILDVDSLKLNAFSKEDEKLLLQLSNMLVRETKWPKTFLCDQI